MTTTDVPQARRRITDETIEALQRRIGIPVRRTLRPTSSSCRKTPSVTSPTASARTIPSTATRTTAGPARGERHRPAAVFAAIGMREPAEWTPEQAEAMSGGDPLAGIGQYMIRESWTFYRPVQPGVTMHAATGPAPGRAQAIGD